MPMKHRRLLYRLSGYTSLLIASFTVAILLLSSKAFKEFGYSQLRSELTSYAKLVASELPDDEKRYQGYCMRTAKAIDSRVTLINTEGVVVGDSDEEPSVMGSHGDRPEIREAYAGRTGSSIRVSGTLGAEMLYLATPVIKDDTVVLVVRCSLTTKEISKRLVAFNKTVVVGAIVIALLGIVGAVLISRRISTPIEEIRKRTTEIANGQFGKRLPTYQTEELASLSEAINQMSLQLKDRIDEISGQNEELMGVLKNMQEAVISFDGNRTLRIVNAAATRLFGLDPKKDGLTGRTFDDVFKDSPVLDWVEELEQEGLPQVKDVVFLNGQEHFLKAFGTPLGAEGGFQGYLLVLTDVTEIRRLENLRRDFVANVSHELKTPITAIQGAIEILEEGEVEPDRRRFIDIARKHSERLATLIQDILTLSKVESEMVRERNVRAERCKLILTQVQDLCQESARAVGKELVVECEPDTLATLNPVLFEQALVNLVDNAIKYSADSPKIILSCKPHGNRIKFRVQDFGPGIPEADQERIFERFYRLDKARSRKLGGTGLGLAIVKHIASMHNGLATIQSKPGEGCTFTIDIPADDTEQA
jgi:two-component system phosphate regulon sensor histidine kinase PhoR